MTPEERIYALAFNAVGQALGNADIWLRLTVRQAVARAVLAAVLPEHEKQVREGITRDLLAERRDVADAEGATARDEAVITGVCNGLITAVRIVGGES